MVVEILACPMSSLTVARSTPARTRRVAKIVEAVPLDSRSPDHSCEDSFDGLDR